MTAHTPGPWRLVVEHRGLWEPSYYVTAPDPDADPKSGYLEVPFHIGLAGGNARTHKSGRTLANARLIAAAPEMLAALEVSVGLIAAEVERTRDMIDRYPDDPNGPGALADDLKLLGMARAAIAKARGQ